MWHANRPSSGNCFKLWHQCSTARKFRAEVLQARCFSVLCKFESDCWIMWWNQRICPWLIERHSFITPLLEMCFCQLLLEQVLPPPTTLWFQLISLVSGGSQRNKTSWYTTAQAGHSWWNCLLLCAREIGCVNYLVILKTQVIAWWNATSLGPLLSFSLMHTYLKGYHLQGRAVSHTGK